MAESDSILETIVSGLGLEVDESAFNPEIIMYVNSALLTVYQNGAGTPLVVKDHAQTWEEFKDPAQVEGNKMFEQIKLYVMLKQRLYLTHRRHRPQRTCNHTLMNYCGVSEWPTV